MRPHGASAANECSFVPRSEGVPKKLGSSLRLEVQLAMPTGTARYRLMTA
jgi:hypothetical protein